MQKNRFQNKCCGRRRCSRHHSFHYMALHRGWERLKCRFRRGFISKLEWNCCLYGNEVVAGYFGALVSAEQMAYKHPHGYLLTRIQFGGAEKKQKEVKFADSSESLQRRDSVDAWWVVILLFNSTFRQQISRLSFSVSLQSLYAGTHWAPFIRRENSHMSLKILW